MHEVTDSRAAREWSRAARARGQLVGFVPTMGFLHEGHLRLVDHARTQCDVVAMSIFVNPLQFGPHEDFSRYPRDLARDRSLAESRGVDCLFVPGQRDVYPREPLVKVSPGSLAAHLCGPFRPGHFEGVLTVVAKLFHLVEPWVAGFGRKDVQQACMIRRMVQDLDFPIEILVSPTVREPDGLAMSSRNAYLSSSERAAAPLLARALDAVHRSYRGGKRDAAELLATSRAMIAEEPAFKLEYLEAVDQEELAPVDTLGDDTIIAVAARLGKTRLID